MIDNVKRHIIDKFFNPVINANDIDELRNWLREQPSDEIEIFLNYFNFSSDRDKETILIQELMRRKEETELAKAYARIEELEQQLSGSTNANQWTRWQTWSGWVMAAIMFISLFVT